MYSVTVGSSWRSIEAGKCSGYWHGPRVRIWVWSWLCQLVAMWQIVWFVHASVSSFLGWEEVRIVPVAMRVIYKLIGWNSVWHLVSLWNLLKPTEFHYLPRSVFPCCQPTYNWEAVPHGFLLWVEVPIFLVCVANSLGRQRECLWSKDQACLLLVKIFGFSKLM